MTPVSLSTVIPTQVGTSASVGALDAGVDALRLAGWGRSNTDGSLDATCGGPGLRRDDGTHVPALAGMTAVGGATLAARHAFRLPRSGPSARSSRREGEAGEGRARHE